MTFFLGSALMADATARTTLFASRNAAVDDRRLFLGSIAMIIRSGGIEAQRRWPPAHNPITRRSADHRRREKESGFPSLVKGIVHRA